MVELHEEIEPVAAEWDLLAQRTAAPPFLRPGWFSAWGRAFGAGNQRVFCVRRDGQLAGVIPVEVRRGALLSATNWHTPIFGAVVDGRPAASELADALLATHPRRLDLSFVPPAEPLADELVERARADGLPVLERVVERSPLVELEGEWEQFEASLPTRRRSDLRRRRRRLGEQGDLQITSSAGGEALGELLAEGFEVEASGWKGRRSTAISSRPQTARFYEEIARWAASRGWLQLWFLRLDGRALAFAFCIVDADAHYVLKIGMDPAYGRFAPGTLLTREMLVAGFVAGLRRYEFLGQADPYKLVWTDSLVEKRRLQVFATTAAGRASRLVWERGRPAAKRALALARRR